ncbi:MAG: hypothetical protein ACD_65C00192G0002 [uncultured bacterium]|nr:MAG: hypothetical protein ACD_65C00192G0002 [uncultured bacterium]KKT19680.1 MAG: hypothetical protein UW03_C0015G0056 [Candidatus Peregrinibacteria bacterium GW2011_GWA2_43_8]
MPVIGKSEVFTMIFKNACAVIHIVMPAARSEANFVGACAEIWNPLYPIIAYPISTKIILKNPNSSAEAAKIKSSDACGSQ